jgi:hypothetical protein
MRTRDEREWDHALAVPDTQGQPQRSIRIRETPAVSQVEIGTQSAVAGSDLAIVVAQGSPPLCRSGCTRASALVAPPPPRAGPRTRVGGTQRPRARTQPQQR